MAPRFLPLAALAIGLSLNVPSATAEDERAQYPAFLAKAYFEVGVGYIDYPFSARQLEPGFGVESVGVPHAAARVVLLGYRFNERLSAQVSYMRPVEWVRYKRINDLPATRTVWMNLGGVTLRGTQPIAGRLLLDVEGGLGVVTRRGFATEAEGIPIVKDANYWTVLAGGGLRYRLNRSWDLGASAVYTPSHAAAKQPHTLMVSGGFTYNMRPLSEERVRENSEAGVVFPRNLLQLGYGSDASGFHVNHFFSGTVPIFWGGIAQVKQGLALHYHRNVFHTRRHFSLDLGASVSGWESRQEGARFYAASVFPVFRFTPLRVGAADFYLDYSLAGPSTLSRVAIDGNDTGRHFTFQDFMGLGLYAGRQRRVNAEVRIAHYSNGNLFPHNAGVSVPLTFCLGYTFH